MKTILVVNDDGINSIGLTTIVPKLQKLGKIFVVTPDTERSGVGKAISTAQVNVTETNWGNGIKAYAITGTPADCFLIAVNKIIRQIPDLVVSGTNLGPNLGIDDVLTSGTLGAAIEAAIHKVPALAFSYCLPPLAKTIKKNQKEHLEDLELTATLAYKAAKHVLQKGLPPKTDIISINVPEKANHKRIRITKLSYDGYGDIHAEFNGGYKIISWSLNKYPDGDQGTDLAAIKAGYISVTPIKIELIHNTASMKKFCASIS
jgi:5'-nucleotidase